MSPSPLPCRPHPLCRSPPSSPSQFPSSSTPTVVSAAIALVVTRPAPSLPSPLLLPPLPSPSLLLATFVAVAIALFVASAFTCLPPLLPLCRLGWGRGGPYRSGVRSYFARHCQCCHHRRRLCRLRNCPGRAGQMTRGIPMPGRQLAPTWWGCCWRLCSRHHPPCQPTAVAAAVACQRWRRQRCSQRGNKVNKNNNNYMTTTQQPTRQPTRQPLWRGNN